RRTPFRCRALDRRLAVLIEQLTLTNLLSFGENPESVELRDLNVVIGPNGSGKSNLLAAIDLLRNAPGSLAGPIREGGGIRDWLWKGEKGIAEASLDAILSNPFGPPSLRYFLVFTEAAQRLQIVDERIEGSEPVDGQSVPCQYYEFRGGSP